MRKNFKFRICAILALTSLFICCKSHTNNVEQFVYNPIEKEIPLTIEAIENCKITLKI